MMDSASPLVLRRDEQGQDDENQQENGVAEMQIPLLDEVRVNQGEESMVLVKRICFIALCLIACFTGLGLMILAASPSSIPKDDRVLGNLCRYASTPPFPYCDTRLSFDERALDLISRLSTEEKTHMLGNTVKKINSQNIGAYQWWNEGLHGVADSPGVSFNGTIQNATAFPQVITTAASFNKTLFRSIGSAISTEARAFFNAGQAGLTYWAPNVNLFRDPRWGRGQEVSGEDPMLAGDYAENFVRGFQESPEDPSRLKASACCKHFAAYSLEHWNGKDRMTFNAEVTERDLEESYLPAFEACVVRGNVSSIMCSYNAINGVPACVDGSLLTHKAREKWGFQGYITGDCGAVENVFNLYHYDNNPNKVVKDVLSAGVDIACDDWLDHHTRKAVESGEVPESLVNGALMNLIKVQMRLGMFDSDEKQAAFTKIGPADVNSLEHHQLSLEASRQGIVLLKNQNQLLPLPKPTPDQAIALIGPHGESRTAMLGNYFGFPPFVVSLLDGIAKVHDTESRHGCHLSDMNSPESLIDEAENAAQNNARTILAVGIDQSQEAEGMDRVHLKLPGRQHELIRRVAAKAKEANKDPVVVVVLGGGMIDLSEELANENIGAILWTGYPGMFGGQAVAETIFGENNPSGRLTQTFYPASFADKVDMSDMNMHPDKAKNFPGRTYRFYTGEVVLPFGHGLSYSSFTNKVTQGPLLSEDGDTVSLRAAIKNTGPYTGAHVMLVFAHPPEGAMALGDLNRKLVGYARTHELAPGQSQEVELSFSRHRDLVVYPESSRGVPDPLVGFEWKLQLLSDVETWATVVV